MSKTRKKYNDCWMYVLLLSTLVILIESLKTFKFSLFNIELTTAIFFIPITYAIANYITKKYGFKRSVTGIIISAISVLAFVIIMSFAIGKKIELGALSGSLLGYTMSQLVNAMIYKFLLVNTNCPSTLVLLNYVFAYIVFYMIYTLVHLNMIVLDTFWISYFMTLGIQTIISIALTYIDKKILLGIGKDD